MLVKRNLNNGHAFNYILYESFIVVYLNIYLFSYYKKIIGILKELTKLRRKKLLRFTLNVTVVLI